MYQLRKTDFKALRFLDCLKKALIVVYTHMHTYTQKKRAHFERQQFCFVFFSSFFLFAWLVVIGRERQEIWRTVTDDNLERIMRQ